MQTFDVADLSQPEVYKLTLGIVAPRPIGWIGTVDRQGRPNLGPYSFFNAVATNPPVVLYSVAITDGVGKHSLTNAEETGEFTASLVSRDIVEAMNQSAAHLPAGESEFDFAGLTPAPSDIVKAPWVAEAKAAMECKVQRIITLGNAPIQHGVVFGEIVRFHVADDLLDGTRIRPDRLDAVGRMGGLTYTGATDLFDLVRPD
ncbi:MAG: flavin reductase family protein [Acidimicrobiia bacterium]|nr:flavin reductase family protein [Acidimicrobiia bacterium]